MSNEECGMKENIVFEKSMAFAIRIVKLHKYLMDEKREYIMSKQLLRCGTSIGANLAEADCAVSKPDFLNKSQIAFKECNETRYWLKLLLKTEYVSQTQYDSIIADADELFRLLSSITKTTKDSISK